MNAYHYVVGNIDRMDIQALAKLARRSHRILEFGTGGSTQIFAQFAPPGARIWTVDTEPKWQDRTRENIAKLGADVERVTFLHYDSWRDHFGAHPWFDLIFVDGYEPRRFEFAHKAWPALMPTGVMAWHDCRWPQIAEQALTIAARNFLELERIDYGMDNSNVVAITKKPEMPAPCPAPPPDEPWMSAHNLEEPPPWWPPAR